VARSSSDTSTYQRFQGGDSSTNGEWLRSGGGAASATNGRWTVNEGPEEVVC
jgi:hypothetical protein